MIDLSKQEHQQHLLKIGVPQYKIDSIYEKQKRGEKLSNWVKIETSEGNKIIRMPEDPKEIEERKNNHKKIIQHQKLRREQKHEEELHLDEFSELSEEKKLKTMFFKKIEDSIIVKTSCWLWVGNSDEFNKIIKESYETFKHKIDEDIDLSHKCENSKCINPNHLYTTTGGKT
ncbi:MAG: hypothetical protein PHP08_00060 [Candidatus Dojkabacteria bacterium]|nr:hypothetical protein [Candidatus Dojkabacteria bacterium]